jgi:hypothetical protein
MMPLTAKQQRVRSNSSPILICQRHSRATMCLSLRPKLDAAASFLVTFNRTVGGAA